MTGQSFFGYSSGIKSRWDQQVKFTCTHFSFMSTLCFDQLYLSGSYVLFHQRAWVLSEVLAQNRRFMSCYHIPRCFHPQRRCFSISVGILQSEKCNNRSLLFNPSFFPDSSTSVTQTFGSDKMCRGFTIITAERNVCWCMWRILMSFF